MSGKGDRPRPYSVDSKTMESNWEKAFGDKSKKTPTWWRHDCKSNDGVSLANLVGEHCNWCGLNENGELD